jgi:hypothetical protein
MLPWALLPSRPAGVGRAGSAAGLARGAAGLGTAVRWRRAGVQAGSGPAQGAPPGRCRRSTRGCWARPRQQQAAAGLLGRAGAIGRAGSRGAAAQQAGARPRTGLGQVLGAVRGQRGAAALGACGQGGGGRGWRPGRRAARMEWLLGCWAAGLAAAARSAGAPAAPRARHRARAAAPLGGSARRGSPALWAAAAAAAAAGAQGRGGGAVARGPPGARRGGARGARLLGPAPPAGQHQASTRPAPAPRRSPSAAPSKCRRSPCTCRVLSAVWARGTASIDTL